MYFCYNKKSCCIHPVYSCIFAWILQRTSLQSALKQKSFERTGNQTNPGGFFQKKWNIHEIVVKFMAPNHKQLLISIIDWSLAKPRYLDSDGSSKEPKQQSKRNSRPWKKLHGNLGGMYTLIRMRPLLFGRRCMKTQPCIFTLCVRPFRTLKILTFPRTYLGCPGNFIGFHTMRWPRRLADVNVINQLWVWEWCVIGVIGDDSKVGEGGGAAPSVKRVYRISTLKEPAFWGNCGLPKFQEGEAFPWSSDRLEGCPT